MPLMAAVNAVACRARPRVVRPVWLPLSAAAPRDRPPHHRPSFDDHDRTLQVLKRVRGLAGRPIQWLRASERSARAAATNRTYLLSARGYLSGLAR